MAEQDQGIVRTGRGEEQPADKERAQQAHRTTSSNSPSREATGRPEQDSKRTKTD